MKHRLLVMALIALAASAERKPDNIPVSIWVREDLFAGFLANDMERFKQGEQKLADLLAENPNNGEALTWKAGVEVFHAVQAFEAGNRGEFDRRYKAATTMLDGMYQRMPNNVGVLAVYGGMIATTGHRFPADVQMAANKKAVELFLQLEKVQKDGFEKMPVHHRGEVLAGVAQAAARSGQDELARTYLRRIVETMDGTPYASIARRVLERPELAKTAKISCNTCHEPNRLANYKPPVK